ncbi:hypothetical protein [Actinoallomurus acaciae]|uniref:Uncharacterized protein n=1 Tax=Actinoallomurus acaciae TaxID=502577 RepID=A0ABV5YJG5_9ACTN
MCTHSRRRPRRRVGTRQILQDKLPLGRGVLHLYAEQSPRATTIRYEPRTTGEVIDKIATTPRAIGHAGDPATDSPLSS